MFLACATSTLAAALLSLGNPGDLYSRLPDVLPPDSKTVGYELKVHLGPCAVFACREYKIKPGDCLESIARHELGDPRKVPELVLLNPKVDPAKLRPGQMLVLPPLAPTSRPESQSSGGDWVLFVRAAGPGAVRSAFLPLVGGVQLRDSRNSCEIIAVPRARIAEFAAIDRERERPEDLLGKRPWIARAEPVIPTRVVPRADPTSRIEATIELTAIDGAKIGSRIVERAFDKAGALISEQVCEPTGRRPRRGEFGLPVLVLGVVALAGLLGMWIRRGARRVA